ncbi:MAG: ATP-binding protein [Candidatus Saccharimonadales bacterium]
MKKPILVSMFGLPFSGKTTLAQKVADRLDAKLLAYDWTWARVKPPEQVPELDNVEEWNEVLDIVYQDIEDELAKGKSVVFDHINHTVEDRDNLRRVAREAGVRSAIIYLDIPLEVTQKRRADNLITKQRHDVSSVNLEKVYKVWENPASDEEIVVFKPDTDIDELIKKLEELD